MTKNMTKKEGHGSRKKYAELLCDFMFKRFSAQKRIRMC